MKDKISLLNKLNTKNYNKYCELLKENKILKENNLAMQGEMCRTWKRSERIKKSLRKQNSILWRQKLVLIDRIKEVQSLLSYYSSCQVCEHTQDLAIKIEDILNGDADEQ